MPKTLGIHHVTAIASGPQQNIDFHTRVLGLRLVKKTVNFDEPGTYHFYFGDHVGTPGTVLSFFPFSNAGSGRIGPGMASSVAFRVPTGGLEAWMLRLADLAIEFEDPEQRFNETVVSLRDPDGLVVELVETSVTKAEEVTDIEAIHGVTLCLECPDATADLLTALLGYKQVDQEGDRIRFRAADGESTSIIDLRTQPERMHDKMGAGSIHHWQRGMLSRRQSIANISIRSISVSRAACCSRSRPTGQDSQ
jgi:glyoxalase family protein